MIQANNLSVMLNGKSVLNEISFDLKQGDWLMVVGPNGAGKSSLVKALSGAYPYTGNISLKGRDLRDYRQQAKAQKLGILMQHLNSEYDYSVRQIVEMGRYPHLRGWLKHLTTKDHKMVNQSLELTGMTAYAETSIRELSGGEIQRAFLSQVLAQDPSILILDEPTNHLDLIYEETIFKIVRQWLLDGDRSVVTIVHDLSLAKQYGSHGLLLDQGHLAAQGAIDSVLEDEVLNQVYGVPVRDYLMKKYSIWQEE